VTKDSQNVTYNALSLGGTKNSEIETMAIGDNLEVSSNADWITNISISAHNSEKYYDIKFNVSANLVDAPRTGVITFTYNSKTATLNVSQAAGVSSYTIYINTQNNLSSYFDYMKINGGSLITLSASDSNYKQIYQSTSGSNTVTVELQPKNNTSASLTFSKDTHVYNSNHVGYTSSTRDPNYNTIASNFSEELKFQNNIVSFKTSDNEDLWINTMDPIRTSIALNSFTSDFTYPTINVIITN